jgi:predicted SAM-dependent methyltransferase
MGGIYSEHCIEHVDFEDGRRLVSEFFRIMAPGAYVRIVVPDGELYMLRYCEHLKGTGRKMPYSEGDSVAGIYTPMMSVNRIMRAHGHRFIYDFKTLRAILADAGFSEIQRRSFDEGADARLLIDTPSRAIESLYVEARKA